MHSKSVVRLVKLAGVTAAVMLAGAAPAAALDVIVQDDPGVMDPQRREQTLARMTDLGATHVRVFVQHKRTGPPDHFLGAGEQPSLAAYADAFAAIRAAGLEVYANVSWYGEGNPDRIAGWAGQAAQRLSPLVDSWAILNEPDLSLPIADCTPQRVAQILRTKDVEQQRVHRYRYRRVGRHTKGVRYRRTVRLGTHNGKGQRKRIVRYVRHRKGRYFRRSTYRTIARVRPGDVPVSLKRACERVSAAAAYTAILRAAAPAIRSADPDSLIVGGEISPVAGNGTFADAVDWQPVDAVSIHPYIGHGGEFDVERLDDVTRRFSQPVIASEFGVHPSPDQAKVLERSWRLARSSDVRGMAQYMLFRAEHPGGWDTGLLPVGAQTSAAYEAVRRATR